MLVINFFLCVWRDDPFIQVLSVTAPGPPPPHTHTSKRIFHIEAHCTCISLKHLEHMEFSFFMLIATH